jgi:proton-dependent oligopeptide transporter, POT family
VAEESNRSREPAGQPPKKAATDPTPSPTALSQSGTRRNASPPAQAAATDKLPAQALFIVGNEACERFSYYGMRAILFYYLTSEVMRMSDAGATTVTHLFYSAVYFMPLLGAWLADRCWGRYRTILYISFLYCLGNLTLALAVGSRTGLCLGLLLIAIGSGGIKPCVSAFVGDQFGPHQQHLLPKVYMLFYWAINLGCFFAFGLIPTIQENYGYRLAFAVPGFFMFLATLIFWLGRGRYTMTPPTRDQKGAGVLRVWWHALRHRGRHQPGQAFLDTALDRFSPREVASARAVAGILMIFASVPVFWALFDQTSTTWVAQGKKMTELTLFSFHLAPATWGWLTPVLKLFFSVAKDTPGGFVLQFNAARMQTMGPLLVVILIPVFTLGLYPLLARLGVRFSPLRRMGAGMVLGALSFVIVAWIQSRIDALPAGQKMSIAWQIIPYILIEAGEVLLSATGLEFAFSQAPSSLKSTILSFWLLTVAVGDYLVAVVTGLNRELVKAEGASQFAFYAVIMFLGAAAFILCAMRYQERRPETPAAQPGDGT